MLEDNPPIQFADFSEGKNIASLELYYTNF